MVARGQWLQGYSAPTIVTFATTVQLLFRSRLCRLLRPEANDQVEPESTGEAEPPNEEDTDQGAQPEEAGHQAQVKDPMSDHDEAKADEGREDVGHEHGAVVEAGFRFHVCITDRAPLVHLKGAIKAKRPGGKHIPFVAFGTFVGEHGAGIFDPLHRYCF